ncbi:SH3 domain-containing protein [Croceicoccus bisphenolivorans]|uniref:SH3 domain-containing protein n=1 Tax=Croceicoccus bisphenolivorans TaxID=1783232 RepID=UPI000832056B|nr:SH3 domain-containing protein [Croceicoccus bisphenolivorans]
MFRITVTALAALLLAQSGPALAEEEVPYWVSLRADEANMRVGPSESYPIEWVYQRVGLPMKVVRKLSGWRLVEDPDGTRGWIVSRFLSLERTAIVTGDEPAAIRAKPEKTGKLLWRAEPGVSGELGECRDGWCRFAVGEKSGWMAENRLWGTGEP